jgi:hypothetical protein
MATQQSRMDRLDGSSDRIDGNAPRIERISSSRVDGPMPATDDAPMGDLLKQLAAEGGDLVRNELALAKLEMRDMAKQLAADSAKVAAAMGLALAGVLVLLAAAVIGLGALLGGLGGHYALSALIIGGVMLLVGGILARSGMAGLKSPPTPDQTVESIQRTKDWAGREAREFKEEVRNA